MFISIVTNKNFYEEDTEEKISFIMNVILFQIIIWIETCILFSYRSRVVRLCNYNYNYNINYNNNYTNMNDNNNCNNMNDNNNNYNNIGNNNGCNNVNNNDNNINEVSDPVIKNEV